MTAFALRLLVGFLLSGIVQGLCATERIALLPFADPGSHEDARALVNKSARSILTRRHFELVAEDSVTHVLRELRVRNTATPTDSELQALADSLNTEFVLVGTIHQFNTEENFTEVTLSARLIRAADATMIWTNWITVSGGGDAALISKPVFDSDQRVARVATKRLLSSARTSFKTKRKQVMELRTPHAADGKSVACSKVAVIPPTNESAEEFAGEMVGDLLVVELVKRGFVVAEPGAVRSIMLQCDDLRHGQSVEAVSRVLADSLGVDIVLTGSISALTDSRSAILGTTPEMSVELRMIDARLSTLVWAQSFSGAGDQGLSLFKLGVTHSPAALAQQLIRDAVADLRVVRHRITLQPN